MITPVRSENIHFPHGFFGKAGGVSTGVVAGLNTGLGAGDDPRNVAENRQRAVAAAAPGRDLVTVYQIHSATAVVVDRPFPRDGERPHADAIVSATKGLALGIVTADCAPVLLADETAGVIAAAHAGWKGASGGVIGASVAAMVGLGADPSRITAAIGPCIARSSYEVDCGFLDRFAAENAANERFFTDASRPGHAQFDLEAYVAARLAEAGVRSVNCLGIDTYSASHDYFSFRRATHRGEPTYGRQLSIIALA